MESAQHCKGGTCHQVQLPPVPYHGPISQDCIASGSCLSFLELCVQIFPYLDDCLVWRRSVTLVQNHIIVVRLLFSWVGKKLNVGKSTLQSTQRIIIIRAVLDAPASMAYLQFQSIVGKFQSIVSVWKP